MYRPARVFRRVYEGVYLYRLMERVYKTKRFDTLFFMVARCFIIFGLTKHFLVCSVNDLGLVFTLLENKSSDAVFMEQIHIPNILFFISNKKTLKISSLKMTKKK